MLTPRGLFELKYFFTSAIQSADGGDAVSAEAVKSAIKALIANEGAKILEEGIAMRASDIDVTYVYGYAFPVHRGGPMFWADLMGLPTVLEKIKGFHAAGYGDVWTPAPLIERLVAEGKSFRDADAEG